MTLDVLKDKGIKMKARQQRLMHKARKAKAREKQETDYKFGWRQKLRKDWSNPKSEFVFGKFAPTVPWIIDVDTLVGGFNVPMKAKPLHFQMIGRGNRNVR